MLTWSEGVSSPVLKLRYIEKGLITIDPSLFSILQIKGREGNSPLILTHPFLSINGRNYPKTLKSLQPGWILWALFLQRITYCGFR
jgi:hypothetical protein